MPYPSKTDRQTILATAMDQVSRDGINKLAIRSVAASLGLAPNALYRYFANLAALEDALGDESRRRVLEVLREAAGEKPPEEAIRSIAQAYVRFAREQPQVFAITLLPVTPETKGDAHVQSWHFILEHVSRIYGEERAPEATITLWAFLYGITALDRARVFSERRPISGFEFGLRMWINSATADTS